MYTKFLLGLFGSFGHAQEPAFESDFLNFGTFLQSFISISIVSPNFRTINPVVTENSSGQNLSKIL